MHGTAAAYTPIRPRPHAKRGALAHLGRFDQVKSAIDAERAVVREGIRAEVEAVDAKAFAKSEAAVVKATGARQVRYDQLKAIADTAFDQASKTKVPLRGAH